MLWKTVTLLWQSFKSSINFLEWIYSKVLETALLRSRFMFKFEFDPQKVSHFECFCYFVFNTITLFPDHFNILIPDKGNKRLSIKAGISNRGMQWGEWWECGESGWECGKWQCECGDQSRNVGKRGWIN